MSRKVLLDVDPGSDDAVALALALAREDLDVVGVTTVAGNSTVRNTTRNALGILELFDRTDVPVAAGCDRPLATDLETAEGIHGAGGIRGDLPEPTSEPIDAHAASFIREMAAAHGEELTVVALGPPTNVAVAMAVEPALSERVGEIAAMGGVVNATGNRTPMAEANFHADPAAARRVVRQATPRLVGLNVTYRAEVPPTLVGRKGRTGRALGEWLDYYPARVRADAGLDHSPQHDAVPVADLVADVVTYDEAAVDVVAGDGRCRGAVVYDEYDATDSDRTARVGLDLDADRFRAVLREALSGLTPG